MAASALSLEEVLSCSVCCDIFREPVLLGCGHSLCRECLNRRWSSSRGRRCAVCKRPSLQDPLLNISLRSTCEFFLQQRQQQEASEALRRRGKKEEEEEEEQEEEKKDRLCRWHGQKLAFFCETEEVPICLQCKNGEHRSHRVLSVQKAVKERKASLAAAARPLREALDALRNGSAVSPNATEHIKAVVKNGKRQIRKEFEKLFTFLKEEQEAHLEAMREAGVRETQLASEAIKARATLLSDRVQEAEELAKKDDIAFLQSFKAMEMSIILSRPDPAWCPWTMSDIPKQLGNLRFNVWKKMKEAVPYYPVILAPSSPHLGVTLSGDLTSVTATPVLDPSAPSSTSFTLAVGSEAFYDGCHAWDVHVGDSSEWVVGVTACGPGKGKGPVSLSPSGRYWAIQRKEGGYFALTFPPTPLRPHSSSPLKVLRVKLLWALALKENIGSSRRVRKVTFSDAQNGWDIFSFSLGGNWPLYPFLCPLGQGAKLRIEQAEVKVELKEALLFWERCPSEVVYLGFLCFLILFCLFFFLIFTPLAA